MKSGAEANVTDGAAQALLDEKSLMGKSWISHALDDAKLVLLPNIMEKKENGYHERRPMTNHGLVPYQVTRTCTTMRMGVMPGAESWLMRAMQELRQPQGASDARRELWLQVQTITNAVQVDLELWTASSNGQPAHQIVNVPVGKNLYDKLEVRRAMVCPPANQEQQLQDGDVTVDGAALRRECAFEFTAEFFYGATCVDAWSMPQIDGVALGKPGKVIQRFVLLYNGMRISVDTPPFVVVSNKTKEASSKTQENGGPYDIALCAAVRTGSSAAASASDSAASSGVATSAGSSSASSFMQDEGEENEVMALSVAIFNAEAKDIEGDLEELGDLDGDEVQAACEQHWSSAESVDEHAEKRLRTTQSQVRSPENVQRSAAAATPQTETTFRSCGSDDGTSAPSSSSPSRYRSLSDMPTKPLLDAQQMCYRGAAKPVPLDKFRIAAAAVQAMKKLQALVARVERNKQATPADCAELVQLRQSVRRPHAPVQG